VIIGCRQILSPAYAGGGPDCCLAPQPTKAAPGKSGPHTRGITRPEHLDREHRTVDAERHIEMSSRSVFYRDQEKICRKQAATAPPSHHARQAFEDLANQWRTLAEDAERKEQRKR
jgi:hypothetical protein